MKVDKTVLVIVSTCLCLIIGSFLVIRPYAEAFWASFMDFTHPKYYLSVERRWEDKSTDFLMSKLGHPSMYDGIASSILCRRKNFNKNEEILRIIKNDLNVKKRSSALSILFCHDEGKAIDISMAILRSGRKHPLYNDALLHLSKRKYESAYPYVIQLAKEPDRYNNGSSAYLADFGKAESLPILEEMLKSIDEKDPTKDPMVNQLLKHTIQDAIQSIKKQNNIS